MLNFHKVNIESIDYKTTISWLPNFQFTVKLRDIGCLFGQGVEKADDKSITMFSKTWLDRKLRENEDFGQSKVGQERFYSTTIFNAPYTPFWWHYWGNVKFCKNILLEFGNCEDFVTGNLIFQCTKWYGFTVVQISFNSVKRIFLE